MRTEDDIRRALEIEDDDRALARLTRFADDLADRPATALGSSTRRRVLPVLAAAAAVVLVAGGGVALVQLGNRSPAPTGGSSPAVQRPVWNLRVAAVSGYTVTRVSASSIGLASGSTLTVASTDAKRPEQGVITTCPMSLRRCADPSRTRHVDVSVGGHPGYFLPGGHVGRGTLTAAEYRAHPWQAARRGDQPGLTWDAGQHTTVLLSGTFGFDPRTRSYDNAAARAILLRIASATSAGHRDSSTLPFQLPDLPAQVAPVSVRIGHGEACSEYGTGPRSVSDALGVVFTACRVRTGTTVAATVQAADRADSNPTNGNTRFEPEHPVVVDHGDGTSLVIAVEPDRRAIVSRQQARQIAVLADVSPRLGDPSTWIVVR